MESNRERDLLSQGERLLLDGLDRSAEPERER